MDNSITLQTKQMIDNLKAVCTNFGLGNASSEYKIITEVFLYKFLNDKFLAEAKIAEKSFKDKTSAEVEKALSEMTEDEYEMFLLGFRADVATLKKEHLISYLFNRQNTENFHKLFDDTLIDIANHNIDVFSVNTGGQSKMRLFSGISQHVIEVEKKDDFCKAIISKIASHSFEKVFEQKYDFFAQIFEYLVKDYNKDFGKYAEYYTPHSIATIIAKILVPEGTKNVTVYDPAAGTGTLVLALAHQIGEDNCTIFAQDISQKSNEFLRLNLILNNLVHSLPNIVNDDTLLHPYHKNSKGDKLAEFDYIVSNPPFNIDFSDNRNEIADEKHKKRFFAGVPSVPEKDKDQMAIYLLFLQHIIYSLKEGGKAAVVVPTGFLTATKRSKHIAYDIRKHLIDSKMLSGVISMPTNVFANTTTNVSVLFISKTHNEKIVMVDASSLGVSVKEGKNQRTILEESDVNKIITTFKNVEENHDFSTVVSSSTIKENKYSFGIAQYFKPDTNHIDLDEEEYINHLYDFRKNVASLFNFDILCSDAIKKIFDYWFVQYDFPIDGKPYKSSGGKMQWSEKLHKNIPDGWEVKNIASICKVLLGGTPDTAVKEYWNGEIPWLSSGEVSQFPIYSSEKSITKKGMESSATEYAEKGAVLLSITRYIRASILAINACFNQSVVAILPNDNYPTSFIYPYVETQISRYMALRTGAQQPHINKNTVEETLLAVPPQGSNLINMYKQEVKKMCTEILADTKKYAESISLNDFDMPTLMNGKGAEE